VRTTDRKCNQCGSPLIFLRKTTEKIESYSPIIVSIYTCSNKECQDDIDKKTLARIKDTNDQKIAKEKRLLESKIKITKILKKPLKKAKKKS
jgi:hypothetical protein